MYTINPITGNSIKVGGPTYRMLQREKSTKNIVERSPRSRKPISKSPKKGTKGWRSVAPKRGKQRSALKKKCGSKCFLSPKDNKYPICTMTCKRDCRGIKSAKVRSAQFKNKSVLALAKRMDKKFCL